MSGGLMSVPWKETAKAEQINGRWYVVIAPKGIRAYQGGWRVMNGRHQLIFYEDIEKAYRFEMQSEAQEGADFANRPDTDTLTIFDRPRRGAELMKGQEGQECTGV